MSLEQQKVTHRRGHNALVTGLAMLVFGIIGAIMPALSGLGVLVAVAGLVTMIIGVGMRRER